ncbi:glycosyltransferase [Spiribacter halobius]|uniref:glycosyltransferase n=1 Tax=Sediminicurvatus halobius TaxID=2182432 RepID=UPI001304988C|nr:glycosyltransferase [Spiribacter halobius]UEX76750.1 glycosyltransferase [Spiribacter halobius]
MVHAVRTTDPAAGGFVTYLQSLRRGMTDDDIELCWEGVFPRNANWRVLALLRPLRFLRRVRRQLETADLLHVHGVFGWHVLLSLLAARSLGRPHVVSVHGHLHPDALRERRLSKRICLAWFGRRALRRAEAVLVTAPPEREIVRRYAPQAHIVEVMPGLEVPPVPESGAVTRAGEAPGPIHVLYLGRLHPHKGLHRLIRALGEARAEGLDAELIVAGTGSRSYRLALWLLVRGLGLRQQVRFLGHVGAGVRARLWRRADVFALPSRSENFGFAAAEAMAAGVPVIVSENVGLASLVAGRGCGEVVPPENTEALRRALLAYADPSVRREQGRRAHEAAVEAFSLQTMGAAHGALYRRVAGTARGMASVRDRAPDRV